MAYFTITANGMAMGTYGGANESEALEAYARDAGYKTYADACEAAGTGDGEVVVVEERSANLSAENKGGVWCVVDGDGGVWWPSEEAAEEIEAADDSAAKAVEICDTDPMRGEWKS